MLRAASAFGGAVSWAAMATFESVAHFVAAIDVPFFTEDVGVGAVPPLRHDAVAELHSGRGLSPVLSGEQGFPVAGVLGGRVGVLHVHRFGQLGVAFGDQCLDLLGPSPAAGGR
jgi:hypothetical protein